MKVGRVTRDKSMPGLTFTNKVFVSFVNKSSILGNEANVHEKQED